MCGKPGHLARDCWRKVKQVTDSQGLPSDTATAVTTSSSQATTTRQPGIKCIEFVEEEVSQVSQESSNVMIFDLRPNTGEGAVRAIKFYHLAAEDQEDEASSEGELTYGVRLVQDEEEEQYFEDHDGLCQVIVDSGADATILPASYLQAGSELLERAPRLQDAQGERIPIKGYKNVSFVCTAADGRTVLIREKAHFAEGISQPIIFYGKLMESGWGIDGCHHALVFGAGRGGEVRIPLKLQNKSLVAECRVRAIGVEAHTWRRA